MTNCNATYSGFESHVKHIQAYANDQIIRSFDHLLMAVNFGSYVHNRPGFEKTFRELSDTAWNRGLGLIKHITKRGGSHDFSVRSNRSVSPLELSEIESLALALDIEKGLATKAHNIHELYSHANHKAHYDAEVYRAFSAIFLRCPKRPTLSGTNLSRDILVGPSYAGRTRLYWSRIDIFSSDAWHFQISHYIEEEFIESQAGTIRKLAGHVNDLKHLMHGSNDASLALYMFDEYLQKQ